MQPEPRTRIDLRFFLLFIPAAYVTYLFHEFGHWSVGEVLGNRMVYSLNYVWPSDGHYLEQSHGLYVSIGGPAFSVIQALVALLVAEKFGALYVYPLTFFPMFNRLFSILLGGLGKQDEARISAMLGTGPYLVAFIVLLVLLLIVIRCSFRLNMGLRMNAYCVTVSTVCQLMVIGTYELIKV